MNLETTVLVTVVLLAGLIGLLWSARQHDRIQKVTHAQQARFSELLERQEKLVERIERLVDGFEARSTQS